MAGSKPADSSTSAATADAASATKFQPLTLAPIEFSLTAGTNIPAPPETPPETPGRPPTPGKGPLSSHPTTPKDASGAFPPSPTPQPAQPLSPTSTTFGGSKKASSIRKFLSLRSLHRGSANSSSSLAPSDSLLPRSSHSTSHRPGSPHTTSSATTAPASPSLSRKKSSAWFSGGGGGGAGKRKSGMLLVGRVDEPATGANGTGAKGEEGKEERKGPPPPTLPDIKEFRSLAGEKEEIGSFGGEDMFKGIK